MQVKRCCSSYSVLHYSLQQVFNCKVEVAKSAGGTIPVTRVSYDIFHQCTPAVFLGLIYNCGNRNGWNQRISGRDPQLEMGWGLQLEQPD